MSKPDKPGELREVDVEAISLVTKAANGERFKIFKSEKEEGAPEAPAVQKDERGLFDVLKAYFSGGTAVEKGELADTFNAQEKGRRLGVAVDALWSTLKYNRWGGENKDAVTDPSIALEDFKRIAEEVLLGKDADIVKAVEEIEKSGRKISGARLTELKAAQAALAKIIEETDSEGDATDVTKEELVSLVKGSVEEAVKPLNERLEKLEKEDGGAAPAEGEGAAKGAGTVEPHTPDIAEVVKSAVIAATAPLTERLEKIEKARGFSNRVPEDTSVRKDGGEDLWGDLL